MLTLLCLAVVALGGAASAYGQGTSNSSITGTILDQSGAVIPGADVLVKNEATGAEYRAVAADNGIYTVPLLPAGTYTVTVSAPRFKQAVLKNVVVRAAMPTNLPVTLQVGGANEVVTVEAGAAIVQSQSANIATTLEVRQISQLPLQARNVIYYLMQLPGVSSAATASPRNSTVNGMPPTAYNITIDGLNTQDNLLKDSDGFFSYIYPTMDAIQEVTLSTATPGAESAGQGAVQIKFVTRSGTNDYHGSIYEYHRNPALNSNYWFNNRDQAPVQDAFPHAKCGTAGVPWDPETCHAPRDRVLFNQFGGRVGGPISIPGLFNGKDRAFFFVNFENFRLPNSISRVRTILNPTTQAGIFQYTVSGATRQVDLLALAAANGQTSTVDPTVAKLLSDIRTATAQRGGIVQLSNPNLQSYTFANYGIQKRYYPTVRFDFNLSSKHHLENTWNYQSFLSFPDTLNSMDSTFPGFPNAGGQNSNRFSDSVTLRSTLTPRLVNEARAGLTGGTVLFATEVNSGQFSGSVANQDGFSLGINAAGISNASARNSSERRNTPIKDVADTMTWSRGAHGLSFGFQFTQVNGWINDISPVVPTIGFGIATGDPADAMFTTANFPGASSTNLSDARAIYSVLTGRVNSIGATAYLDENSNQYKYLGSEVRRSRMREWGFFVTDSWRARPNLTLTYGLRWELQRPFTTQNGVYSTVSPADMWGVSGPGNMFKPGTLLPSNIVGQTYHVPVFVQWPSGSPAYNPSWRDFAPSVGFAWSPRAEGFLGRLLGSSGQTVLRGGYSIAYNRPGTNMILTMFDSNTGLYVDATRSATLGNLVTGTGTDVLPVLFRDKGRLSAPSFPSAPSYPMSGNISQSMNNFDPKIRTPYAQSWTFGIQREITKDMVVEVRYVHNLNLQNWMQYQLNEVNIVENGFLNEFKNAMANLQANQAAGRGNNFKYYGPGTGTYPLPIYLAYFSGVPASQASDPSMYTASQFSSSTWYNPLAAKSPAPYTPASSSSSAGLYGSATFRANALAAGLPPNFFVVNPDYLGGAWIMSNGGSNRYDSGQVEVRRRLAHGLLLNSNYVFAKAYAGSRYSFRTGWVNNLNTSNGGTVQHSFKMNWVFELPVGAGKALFANSHGIVERIIGGWEWDGTVRIQTGPILNLGNVNLVGMTKKDLQDAYGLRFDDANRVIYIYPQDIIDNTYKANNVSATSATGYSASGVPSGRYFAPANSFGCIQVVTGDCAPRAVIIHGPDFVRFDMSAVKRIRFTETKNFELRAEFLNAFNNVNFLGNTNLTNYTSTTFGQVTSAYRDVNNTQDPGGRLIQFVARINF
jgi:hypothetical protein